MIRHFTAVVAVLAATAGDAVAQDNPFTNDAPPGAAAVEPAPIPDRKPDFPARIVISRESCARLARHQPAPDVAYRPGVDVRGRPVVPADGGEDAFQYTLPPQISFDVSFNPLRGGAAGRFDDTAATVGRVEVDLATGAATFNGQRLTDVQTLELSQKCQRIMAGQGG